MRKEGRSVSSQVPVVSVVGKVASENASDGPKENRGLIDDRRLVNELLNGVADDSEHGDAAVLYLAKLHAGPLRGRLGVQLERVEP